MRKTVVLSVLLVLVVVMMVGAQEESGYGRLWRELEQDLDQFLSNRELDLNKLTAFHTDFLERVTGNYAEYSNDFIKKTVDSVAMDFFKQVLAARFETTILERMQDSDARRSYFRGLAELLSNRAFVLECLNSSKDERLLLMRLAEFWNEGGEDSYAPVAISSNVAAIQDSRNDLRINRIYLQSDWGYQGNKNKAIDAGETVKLGINLKNLGKKDWRSTSAFLISMDPYVQVDVSEVVYSVRDESTGETRTFVPGMEIPSPTVYTISISPACPDSTKVKLKLRVWDSDFGGANDEYAEYFTLNVSNIGPLVFGDIKIDDDIPGYSDGDGNGRIDPRETIEYQISLRNQGVVPIDNVFAEMSTNSKFISFLKSPIRGSELRFKRVEPKAERPSSASFVFSVGQPETITDDSIWLLLKTRATARDASYSWLDSYTEKVVKPERLLISTTPETAEIFVNGTNLGPSPAQTLPILAGTKIKLDARLSDGFIYSQNVEILPGQKEILIDLMRVLTVVSTPERAEIFVNGRPVGTTPVKLEPMRIGKVIDVEGRFEGMSSGGKVQILGANPVQELRFEKKIMLASDPPGAMMSLDGQQIGKSPIETPMLLIGTQHSVFAEFGSWSGRGTFSAGTATDSFMVKPESGAVSLKVFPENSFGASDALDFQKLDGGFFVADHVAPGNYEIEFSSEGFETEKLNILVAPGETLNKEVVLDRALRNLNIVSTPPGARILVQGNLIGIAPLSFPPIEVGTRVSITADFGRMSAAREITVTNKNDPVEITPDNGVISIEVSPPTANVLMEGINLKRNIRGMDSTVFSADNVKFGKYRVTASADGYETIEHFVTVSEASISDKPVSLGLKPLIRTISVFTDIENAIVELNGKFIGYSPILNYSIEHDIEYEVSASLDDYFSYRSESKKVKFAINEGHKDLNIKLIPKTAALSIMRDSRYFPSDPDIKINGKKLDYYPNKTTYEVPAGPQLIEINRKLFQYKFAEGGKYELKILYPVPIPSVIVDKNALNLEREPMYPSLEREFESYETKDIEFTWKDPLAFLAIGTIGIYYNVGGWIGYAISSTVENPDWQAALSGYLIGTAIEYFALKIILAPNVTKEREIPEAVSRNQAALEAWKQESARVYARNEPIITARERQLADTKVRVIEENKFRNKATIIDMRTKEETVFNLL